MPGFYGGGSSRRSSSPSSGTSGAGFYLGSGGGGGGGGGGASEDVEDVGKATIDLTDPVGSIGQVAGSLAGFGAGIVGGVAGAVGSIGFGDGRNVGALADVPGTALEALGGVPLPYLGNDPTRTNATVGDIPQQALDILTLPGRAVERTAAGQRVEAAQRGDVNPISLALRSLPGAGFLVGLLEGGAEGVTEATRLPADLQERLDSGESVDVIADELVARGAGFSNAPAANIGAQVLFDPLNLIGVGLGKAATTAQKAGVALQVGQATRPFERALGTAYNVATHAMTEGQQAIVSKFFGPSTSGALHALGVAEYKRLRGRLGRLAPQYADDFEESFGVGMAQMPRFAIAHYLGEEATAGLRAAKGEIGDLVETRLTAARAIDTNRVERITQEFLERKSPQFAGMDPAELAAESARKLAAITGMSLDDAVRTLGKVDIKTAQQIDLAMYGKAIREFSKAKAAALASGKKANIDIERLTLISRDTLTVERADEVLNLVGEDFVKAVERYDDLSARFGGTAFDHDVVKDYIRKLKDDGVLPTAVRRPTTNKNPLPRELGDFRAQYDEFYELGFKPKELWRIRTDTNGVMESARPWIDVVDVADSVKVANPLGRLADALFRGVSQHTIINDSRVRFVRLTRDTGISPNEARGIHGVLLEIAAREGVAPRGLSLFGGKMTKFDEAFVKVLGEERYLALKAEHDPVHLLMAAFEGNLNRVGLTQKLTGRAKSAEQLVMPGSHMAAAIAEGIYPLARFRLSPLFQAQELAESPFFNVVRGVHEVIVDPDVAKVYEQLAELPEFRYFTEAGYFLNLGAGKSVEKVMGTSSRLGKAMSRFANVKAAKEKRRVEQVMWEHGDAFQEAVRRINPKLWAKMEVEYGTSDPRAIAQAFMRERMRLASGNVDEATGVMDDLRKTLDGAVIREGEEAASRAANVAVGVTNGGTVASGGALKSMLSTADGETIWQAFRESLRQSSRQAFKTHYFNPERGWLERTINHPYLGLYPASYMWGKVLPEFARFLLARPFGLRAPLTGINAVHRVQESVVANLAMNEEFRTYVEENDGAIYLFQQMLPGLPSDLPANAPAWSRHISEDALSGREVTAETVEREVADTTRYALGPVRTLDVVTEATVDVIDNLEKAAAMFDGMFAGSGSPPAP